MKVKPNDPGAVRSAFERALKNDGKIDGREAERIARAVRKDGIGGRELLALYRQLDRFEARIDRPALRHLDRVGSRLTTNSATAVNNNVRVFAADGKITAKETREIIAGAAAGGPGGSAERPPAMLCAGGYSSRMNLRGFCATPFTRTS